MSDFFGNDVRSEFRGRGAGLPIGTKLFCARCLKNGHRCDAIEIEREPGEEALCAFCEDNVPCPIQQRAVNPSLRDRPQHAPMLVNDVLRDVKVAVHFDKKKAKPETVKDLAKMSVAAVKHFSSRKEPVMAEEIICSEPGCGKKLRPSNQSGRCTRHFYVPKHGRKNAGGAMPKTCKPKLQRKTAQPAAKREVATFEGRTAASLIVSEKQIDQMFCAWPLEDKVLCVQAWLDRAEG